MTAEPIPWGSIADPVARALLGEPNARRSTRAELRFGRNGSVAVHIAGPRAGMWRDHERNEGGGLLKLIAREAGAKNGEALQWLRERGFIPAEAVQHHDAPKAETTRAEPPRIVAEYSYHDADGALLFQVVRYAPKSFRQRRPDGRGGWHWNLQDVTPILYRLPELLQASRAAPVFVVEGEKDANALAERLLVATTSPGGAGGWRPVYAAALRGRHVVILPDNDQPGAAHAEAVARALHGVAASVRVLRLPDLPPKGDASDFLAAGGTGEELLALAAAAPEWAPPEGEAPPEADPAPEGNAPEADAGALRDALSIDAWTARDVPAPDRLLGDLVTTTTRTFIIGRTGLGKTLLGLAMAVGMASGRGFLHWRCERPARVLLIDGEMPAPLIRERAVDALRRAALAGCPNLSIFARDDETRIAAQFPALGAMPPLNAESGMPWLANLIDALGGVDVVLFDNVMSLLTGDQKEETTWAGATPLVQELTRRRIGQVWLDHAGHNQERQYGASAKAWRFDSVGILTPLAGEGLARGEIGFALSFDHPGKARRRTPANWADFEGVTIRLADDAWHAEPAAGTARPARLQPLAREWLAALHDAVAAGTTPGRTTREAWFGEAVRLGLAEGGSPDDARDHRAPLRKAILALRQAGLIGVDGPTVTLLGGGAQ